MEWFNTYWLIIGWVVHSFGKYTEYLLCIRYCIVLKTRDITLTLKLNGKVNIYKYKIVYLYNSVCVFSSSLNTWKILNIWTKIKKGKEFNMMMSCMGWLFYLRWSGMSSLRKHLSRAQRSSKKCKDIKWMYFQQKCILHQTFPINCKSSPQDVVALVNAQLYFSRVHTFTYSFFQQIFIKLLLCGSHWTYNELQKHTQFFFMELFWGWLSFL